MQVRGTFNTMRSIKISDKPIMPSMMLIHQTVLETYSTICEPWNIGHSGLLLVELQCQTTITQSMTNIY